MTAPGHRPIAAAVRSVQSVGQQPERPHLIDYARILSKRRWTALTVFVLVVGLTAVHSVVVTPRYQATTQLLIETQRPGLIIFNESIEQAADSADYQQTQYRILQSRGLARRTIEVLGLWQHAELTGAGGDTGGAEGWFEAAGRAVSAFGARLSKSETPVAEKEAKAVDESAQQSRVIDAFLDSLAITPIRNTKLVDVKYVSSDPDLAAKVTDTLAAEYIAQNLEFKGQSAKEASDWLARQLEEQRAQVEQSEARLQAYRERTASISTGDQDNLALRKLSELDAALTKVRTERLQREAAYQQLEALMPTPDALARWPAVATHATVRAAAAAVEDARRKVAQLGETLGELHPSMREAAAEVAVAEGRYRTAVADVVEGVRNDFLAAKAQEASLVEAVGRQRAESLAQSAKEIEFDALERDATSDRQIFESLLQRTKEAGVSGELPSNNIRIVDAADRPRAPISPRRERNLLIASLVGLVLAVGAGFTREYFDKAIKTPAQVKERLGLPCLGLVPAVASKTSPQGPVLTGSVPQHFVEAFRTIRTNVLFAADGEEGRSLLFTSTGPGEGKTIVTCNVAMALAQAGQQVLLVDADMRRPRVHKVLDLGLDGGLADVLAGTEDPDAYVRPSAVAGLSVLTAGGLPPNPHELLSSPRCATVLTLLAQRYQWVLIDTPPIMPVSDAALVAHTAAAVMFVVGSERTTVPAAQHALEQLEAANARFVGVVLNMVQLDRHRFFYSDVYRAEYGQYYRSTAPARPATTDSLAGR